MLQLTHHAIMPIFGWHLMYWAPNGHESFGGIFNALVHSIMYTYYFLAAMGPQFQKYLWWKRYLTQLQLLQFIAVFVKGSMSSEQKLIFKKRGQTVVKNKKVNVISPTTQGRDQIFGSVVITVNKYPKIFCSLGSSPYLIKSTVVIAGISNCGFPWQVSLVTLSLMVLMLVLFGHFYVQEYTTKKKKRTSSVKSD